MYMDAVVLADGVHPAVEAGVVGVGWGRYISGTAGGTATISYHVHPPSPLRFVQIDRSDTVSIDDLMQITLCSGHLN